MVPTLSQPMDRGVSFPKIPSAWAWQCEAESVHPLPRCLPFFTCSLLKSSTGSSRGAGLRSRTCVCDTFRHSTSLRDRTGNAPMRSSTFLHRCGWLRPQSLIAPLLPPFGPSCAPILTLPPALCAPLLTPPPAFCALPPAFCTPPPAFCAPPPAPLCAGRPIGRWGGRWRSGRRGGCRGRLLGRSA